jgi:hypothetical protein
MYITSTISVTAAAAPRNTSRFIRILYTFTTKGSTVAISALKCLYVPTCNKSEMEEWIFMKIVVAGFNKIG